MQSIQHTSLFQKKKISHDGGGGGQLPMRLHPTAGSRPASALHHGGPPASAPTAPPQRNIDHHELFTNLQHKTNRGAANRSNRTHNSPYPRNRSNFRWIFTPPDSPPASAAYRRGSRGCSNPKWTAETSPTTGDVRRHSSKPYGCQLATGASGRRRRRMRRRTTASRR